MTEEQVSELGLVHLHAIVAELGPRLGLRNPAGAHWRVREDHRGNVGVIRLAAIGSSITRRKAHQNTTSTYVGVMRLPRTVVARHK